MYYRKKHGRGFTYIDENGNTVKDKEIKSWINSLAIPPAWQQVEISDNNKNDILVTGRDNKNRKQYIYSPEYLERTNSEKFDRIIKFADRLENMRRVTGQHLRKKELCKEKVLAVMVRLLDSAFFRPGSDYYSSENQTYGLTTLRSKHLSIDNDKLIFNYVGKSGKEQHKEIVDARIAKIVKEIDDLPGYEIFKYIDENNKKVDVKSEDLNAYIREIMGKEFSAKDFRTWAGTMIAAIALDGMDAVSKKDQKLLDKNVREAVNLVSETLGNTPAVARSSYIDPRIIEDYMDGKTIKYFKKEIKKLIKNSKNLSEEELGVLCMLKSKLNS